MYVPKPFKLDENTSLFALIESHPLAAWICQGDNGLIANHIPFFLDRDRGPFGTLIGHVARANPVWKQLPATRSMVLFQGAQAYITPNWYQTKREHGKAVPTWNYAVVHAQGVARAVDDRDWLLDMLNRLTDANEAGQPQSWQVGDAPADFIDKQLLGIVGIEIPIDQLEGKLKASQNQPSQNRRGVAEGLQAQPDSSAQQMGKLVEGFISE